MSYSKLLTSADTNQLGSYLLQHFELLLHDTGYKNAINQSGQRTYEFERGIILTLSPHQIGTSTDWEIKIELPQHCLWAKKFIKLLKSYGFVQYGWMEKIKKIFSLSPTANPLALKSLVAQEIEKVIAHNESKKDILQDYLACESLLNSFFNALNYCQPNCLTKEHSQLAGSAGSVGCCNKNGYTITNFLPNPKILIAHRLKKYGLPINLECPTACNYHSPTGCRLAEFKNPVCLAFICPPFIKYLQQKYDINYNVEIINRFLEELISGKTSPDELDKFKNQLNSWVKIIKNTK
ncbi:MAG: hypothetical protein WC480_04200 [Patescibacteria group bacterium]